MHRSQGRGLAFAAQFGLEQQARRAASRRPPAGSGVHPRRRSAASTVRARRDPRPRAARSGAAVKARARTSGRGPRQGWRPPGLRTASARRRRRMSWRARRSWRGVDRRSGTQPGPSTEVRPRMRRRKLPESCRDGSGVSWQASIVDRAYRRPRRAGSGAPGRSASRRAHKRTANAGRPGTTVSASGGLRTMRWASISAGVPPRNGRVPVSISYRIRPSAYRSLRPSSGSARACSGLRYSGVPMITPLPVMPGGAGRAGHAEVGDQRSPLASSITLAGLRSRWTTPRLCAAARPSASWRVIRTASSTAPALPGGRAGAPAIRRRRSPC